MDAGEDHISGLPDELLNAILLGLRSTRAAARAGALSRRWRHLWTPLPGLFLSERSQDAAFLDTVDAALAACDSAPAIEGLTIRLSIYCRGDSVPAERVAPWLRFASQRVVGPLRLPLPRPEEVHGEEAAAVLDVPACEGVTKLELSLSGAWRVRPLAAGLFWALTDLTIVCRFMDGSELTSLVCKQCPRLMHLKLRFMLLANASDISIRSDSLQSLSFSVCKARLLEIVAPRLEELSVSLAPDEAQISAPKLAEVAWADNYDPRRHRFDDVGRRLRLLEPGQNMSLMQQFDEVDELKLGIYIPEIIFQYENFLNQSNKLPNCKILSISLPWRHGLVPGMLHLLRGCNSTRKVFVIVCSDHLLRYPCPPSCPCREESRLVDDISLHSLEEVEITSHTSSHEVFELVEQLSKCNAPILKKVVMKYRMNSPPPPTKEVREKIRSMFPPNIDVDFYFLSKWKWVLFD
ncbi:unnamed protein product [Urochloa decumbens]|uniref:F-box domain-containing protein n=1 Tax=Urochloa decumbens TaxID=240449 RepID=A0ABC9B1R8_9POAL